MADFRFNDEQTGITRRTPTSKAKGIEGRLIAWGLAKNPTQAKLIMIGIVIIGLAIIIFQNINLGQTASDNLNDPALLP